MTTIAILGAGGKMGCRLTDNLRKSSDHHELLLVEVSEVGKERIAGRGFVERQLEIWPAKIRIKGSSSNLGATGRMAVVDTGHRNS